MKTLKLNILLLLVILFFNCGNDDDTTSLEPENTEQPMVIHLERFNFIGLPTNTYTIGYNNIGQITTIVNSGNYPSNVNYTISYENNKIKEIRNHTTEGDIITIFTYNANGKIATIEETGPEARLIENFEYTEEENTYILTVGEFGLSDVTVALDANNHINGYGGNLITFNTNQPGLFKAPIIDIAPLYLTLNAAVLRDLYFFSQYQILELTVYSSTYFYQEYQVNSVPNITAFNAYIDSDTYIIYSIDY